MMTTTKSSANEDLNNHIAFSKMREELERKFPHQWIVIYDEELKGNYETYDSAREGAKSQDLILAHCLFQKLNATPPIILSYGE